MRPILMTMGDPAGIGPEIAIAAWSALREKLPIVALGDAKHWTALAAAEGIAVRVCEYPEASTEAFTVIDRPAATSIAPGVPDNQNAPSVVSWIEEGVHLAKGGQASALVTNPISKAVLIDGAAFTYPGHTEFLADLDGGADVVMMLAGPELRVVPATIHIALEDVPAALTPDHLRKTILTTNAALKRDFGIAQPRIAVSGLNPHAGESGKMGKQEIDFIAPLLQSLRETGLDLRGPLSADTMFHPAARKTYDAAVCMYHDQALIPLKTLSFEDGVNCTLGLSFVRTSPDHGTAFDIAGQGIASPASLMAAVTLAGEMASRSAA